jgi:hypothetical protein
MPKKRAGYSKTKAVKAMARKRVGAPPAARPLDERTVRSKSKHKKPWTEELAEESQ